MGSGLDLGGARLPNLALSWARHRGTLYHYKESRDGAEGARLALPEACRAGLFEWRRLVPAAPCTVLYRSPDPIQPKRNVARTISSSVVTDVIVGRLRAACLLFGVPRTASGAAICLSADQGAASDADIMVETLQKIPEQELVYTFDSQLLCGQTVSTNASLG